MLAHRNLETDRNRHEMVATFIKSNIPTIENFTVFGKGRNSPLGLPKLKRITFSPSLANRYISHLLMISNQSWTQVPEWKVLVIPRDSLTDFSEPRLGRTTELVEYNKSCLSKLLIEVFE